MTDAKDLFEEIEREDAWFDCRILIKEYILIEGWAAVISAEIFSLEGTWRSLEMTVDPVINLSSQTSVRGSLER